MGAMELAQPDLDAQMIENHRKDTRDAKELRRLVEASDRDGNGALSLDEFMLVMKDPNFRSFCTLRGIDIKDAEIFFHMLSTMVGSGEVAIDTFVVSALRLKGVATSIDLHALSFEVKALH